MNDYINNIVSRHAEPTMNIQPRLTGLFETSYSEHSLLPVAEQTTVVPEEGKQTIESPGLYINDTNQAQPFIEQPAEPFLFDDKKSQPLEDPVTVSPEKNKVVTEVLSPSPLKQQLDPVWEMVTPEKKLVDKGESLQSHTTLVVNKEFHYELINQLAKDIDPGKENVPVIKPGDIDPVINDEKNKFEKKAGQLLFPPVQPVLRSSGNAVEAIFNYHEGSSVIKVSIGRIEVKAVSSESKATKPTVERSSRPTMSLDEYLKKRNIAE